MAATQAVDALSRSLEQEEEEEDSIPEPTTLRSSATWHASTNDEAQALFGTQIGPCWGEFSCSHNRIRGKLYASSQAVLFYSNLLGFERRFCLEYRHVSAMELYRTTSIRMFMVDGEQPYVFKSFSDRESVLQLLQGLKLVSDNKRASPSNSHHSSTSVGALRHAQSASRLVLSPQRSLPSSALSSSSTMANRRRAASDSLVRLPRVQSATSSLIDEDESFHEEPLNDSSSFRPSAQETLSDQAIQQAWKEAKTPKQPPLQQVGIDSLMLPCCLDTFYQTFLADGAPHSFDRYQRDYIKDVNVKLDKWQMATSSDGIPTWTRTFRFTHPIRKSSYNLGPSSAETTRHQRLGCFGEYGISLENTTLVQGIPSADAFCVQDCWLVERVDTDTSAQVKVSVRFDTRFTKRTFLRSVIEKSIRKETSDWFAGYQSMLQSVIVSINEEETTEPREQKSKQPSTLSLDSKTADVAATLQELQRIGHSLLFYARVTVVLLALIFMVLTLLASRNASLSGQVLGIDGTAVDNNAPLVGMGQCAATNH